jgi:hypothetical protein
MKIPLDFNAKVERENIFKPTVGNKSLQWRTQEFFRGGVQKIQLRTEGRENGDLGAVAP